MQSTCRSIVQFLPDAVLLLDEKLRVLLANETAAILFQMPAAQLQGAPITALLPDGKLDKLLLNFGAQRRKVIETALPPRRRGLAATTLKIVAVRLARHRRKSAPALTGASERGEYRLLVVEDISDRTVLEQLLVESEKQAAMGQLAAGILHEVANPLAGLGSNLLFVRSRLDGASQDQQLRQALDTSLDQLNAMRQLLGTLSGFPRRSSPKFSRADLHQVVRDSVAFISNEAQRKRIRIVLSISPSPISCEMDVRLVRQVLLNLLKNAMEAMPEGGRLEVRTRLGDRRRAGDANAVAILDVIDTGVGIAESDLRKVFRPLFSTKPRGAGLGLSFCRQAIEEHGGQIRLTSPGLGQGTVATVCLPLVQSGGLEEND